MIDKHFIFIAGHHRSGTSLLHKIIRNHSLVSGFSQTGVPEDEGQHLQTVYEPAKTYGGPGRYIFNKNSYMNEYHPLANKESAKKIFEEWQRHYDTNAPNYIEKSPPNLIKTRFLQKLFPNSKFVVTLRHPLAVAYATQKWSRTTIESLINHTLLGYEIFMQDLSHLNEVYILRYEDFVMRPQKEMDKIFKFLDLEPIQIQQKIYSNVNDKYFSLWEDNKNLFSQDIECSVSDEIENRANRFGYSIRNYKELSDVSFLGAHTQSR